MKKTLSKHALRLLVACMAGIMSCEDGADGKKSLIDLVEELPGSNCPNGGFKVNSGIDLNDNNVLEPDEVQTSKFVCNGANGLNSLIKVSVEPGGANCANGGQKVMAGNDVNKNN